MVLEGREILVEGVKGVTERRTRREKREESKRRGEVDGERVSRRVWEDLLQTHGPQRERREGLIHKYILPVFFALNLPVSRAECRVRHHGQVPPIGKTQSCLGGSVSVLKSEFFPYCRALVRRCC